MRKFILVIVNVILMSFVPVAHAVEDDGFLNPVDLDLRYYFEQLDRLPERLGVICWASYEMHKEGRHHNALALLNVCSDRGLVPSMLLLANMYELGLSSDTKLPKVSALWLKRAAQTNDSRGQLYYGIALLEGKGVKRNPRIAKQWLTLAANQGDSDAIKILSNLSDYQNDKDTLVLQR
jgi:TPR repeat protein